MCRFRKILRRHLTDFGVVASFLRGFVHNSPIPASADTHAQPRGVGRVRAETQVPGETEQNQDPTKGQINFFFDSLRPKTGHRSPAGLREPMRVCIMCLAFGLCRRCVLEGGMQMHMFGMLPI